MSLFSRAAPAAVAAFAAPAVIAASAAVFAFAACTPVLLQAQTAAITLAADLTDAPRRILHASEIIPVHPGPMTLVYPKWIPGEHAPDGPIQDQAGFIITTAPENGKPAERVTGARDPPDMFVYHLTAPAGTTALHIKMDFLATAAASGYSAGASTSASLALLSWNELLVYPGGTRAADVMVSPSVTIPAGWRLGTALSPTGPASGNSTSFATVSLEQLIDSPVLAGRWFKEIPLAPEITPKHFLDIAGDGPEDLQLSQEHIDNFAKLIRETGALYKSRHYGAYHFLVTLSDQVAHFGLEHHQSSDDRIGEKTFTDDSLFILEGDLLPHEFTHSWNGKYRRPAGLATPDYQQPMQDDLLWVYEGLTEYLGDVLATRSGIWNDPIFRDRFATVWAQYNDARPGRGWRDLQDTATAASFLSFVGGAYDNYRRATDYYDEGEMLWMEVDCTLRQKTDGKKSINDFVAAFHGLGGNTGPRVVPYTFDDIVTALNGVAPNDWAGFLRTRLDANGLHAPETPGLIALSGYKLVYTDKPDYWSQLGESELGGLNARYSLGLTAGANGEVVDVLLDSVAFKAGLAPGFTIVAVNGRAYTPSLLRNAILDARASGPAIDLIVSNTGYYKVIRLDYHDGERYPNLERVPGVPDRLDDILKPMTAAK